MPLQLSGNWTTEAITKSINQIPLVPSFLGDNFFKTRQSLLSANFKIPIMRGDEIIKEVTASGADRDAVAPAGDHIVNAQCYRFTDSRKILATDLQKMAAITNNAVRIKSEAQLIAEQLKRSKNSFTATEEFLRIGAIIGTVLDGAGTKLFEFKNGISDIEFKNATPFDKLQAIENAMLEEFGYAPEFVILASSEFYKNAAAYAETNKLFEKQLASYDKFAGLSGLKLYNRLIVPFERSYNNSKGTAKKFIAANKAIALPLGVQDMFVEFYSYAEDVHAMGGMPQEFFSKLYELPNGKGYSLDSESVKIPINTRPYGVRSLIWSN